MKKFLAIIAIASLAVACNSKGEKKGEDKDTTAKTDTAVVAPTVDTAAKAPADTTAKVAADTTKK